MDGGPNSNSYGNFAWIEIHQGKQNQYYSDIKTLLFMEANQFRIFSIMVRIHSNIENYLEIENYIIFIEKGVVTEAMKHNKLSQ